MFYRESISRSSTKSINSGIQIPCMHSDPRFDDLAPGETGRLKGWLWFYEGAGIKDKLTELKEAFEGET